MKTYAQATRANLDLLNYVKIHGITNSKSRSIISKYNLNTTQWLTYKRATVIREGIYFRRDQFNREIENYEWAQYGNIHVYSHIYENEGFEPDSAPDLCKDAVAYGQLELLKYLHEHGYPWDQAKCWNNMCGMICCKRKYERDYCPLKVTTCAIAGIYGNLECLIYAHENGCSWNEDSWNDDPCNEDSCKYTALAGNLECLKYMIANGYNCSYETCNYAAEGGNLECLKYAFENGCDKESGIGYYAAAFAAKGGNMQCLNYTLNNGSEWSTEVCSNAAKYGHIDILKYAHKNGCPWDNNTCINAAVAKNLNGLKYAVENGCSTKYALGQATYMSWGKTTECMEYLTKFETMAETLRKYYKKCKTLSNIRFLQRFVRNRNVIKNIQWIPKIGIHYLSAQSHYYK